MTSTLGMENMELPASETSLKSLPSPFLEQVDRMPALARQLLVDSVDPRHVDSESLLDSLQLPNELRDAAKLGFDVKADDAVLRRPRCLDPNTCAKLRQAVCKEKQEMRDTVDGAPDHQLNFDQEGLRKLIGDEPVDALWRLPAELAGREEVPRQVEIFVRRYSVDSRPWNPFHTDLAAFTVNVALVDDETFGGGRLLACYDGAIHAIARSEGEATVHSSNLLHAVTMMTSGVRYSLILFFGKAREEHLVFDDRMRSEDCRALCALMAKEEFLRRCVEVLGTEKTESVRKSFKKLKNEADMGQTLEKVVTTIGSCHLRPAWILEREWKDDATCWTLNSLLSYAVGFGFVPHENVAGETCKISHEAVGWSDAFPEREL